MSELLTIAEASKWASRRFKKNITTSNISYLIQYGRIRKNGSNGSTMVYKDELEQYYFTQLMLKEKRWKEALGDDLNWSLSFAQYKESETTKHVHRLHPYKGKFIPQLVEYFLDDHTDKFKKEFFFKAGDIVLDPFCGSGTTLVQANELGMHAVGIDISVFNSLISNAKIDDYDLDDIKRSHEKISKELKNYLTERNNVKFENELLESLKLFNQKWFPSPEYKNKVRNGEINEKEYGREKEKEFLPVFHNLVKKYNIVLKQQVDSSFLDKWFLQVVRDEIDFVLERLKEISDPKTRKILTIILSRTVRSCRATTHADLGTLKEPVRTIYFCKKHGKICKPLFSILNWWKRYSKDTVARIAEFKNLRTDTHQICLTGDSRIINIFEELENRTPLLAKLAKKQKIKGIFSSPPYVGLINYHEQHAYAYDLFGFNRKDQLEIGPLFKGQGKEARESYIEGIAQVLLNSKKYMQKGCDVFLVANDKYNLYPSIADLSGMKIVNQYKRPVLNRVEKDRSAYAEIIFHLKEK